MAVNDPEILELVAVPKTKDVGCAVGTTHGGANVLLLPPNGEVVLYIGPPKQALEFIEKTVTK